MVNLDKLHSLVEDAIADPTRKAILDLLSNNMDTMSFNEIMGCVNVKDMDELARHLNILQRACLVERMASFGGQDTTDSTRCAYSLTKIGSAVQLAIPQAVCAAIDSVVTQMPPNSARSVDQHLDDDTENDDQDEDVKFAHKCVNFIVDAYNAFLNVMRGNTGTIGDKTVKTFDDVINCCLDNYMATIEFFPFDSNARTTYVISLDLSHHNVRIIGDSTEENWPTSARVEVFYPVVSWNEPWVQCDPHTYRALMFYATILALEDHSEFNIAARRLA